MPRNGSGTYTLPSGNPVVAGTTIESTWANTTLSDVATELTNSLSRTGAGGMTGPLRLANGTNSAPSLAFTDETTAGLYRAGAGDFRFVVLTSAVQQWLSSGTEITGTLGASGNFAINTNKFTVAASSGNTVVAGTLGVAGNFAVNTNKFTVAASSGNTLVAGTLDVTGAATLNNFSSSSATLTGGTINSMAIGGVTPAAGAFTTLSASGNVTLSGGTANGVVYLNGSKVATSGTGLVFDGSNLGIGTSSPGRLLTLFNNDQPVLQITNNTSGSSSTNGTLLYQATGSTEFILDNQGSGSGGVIKFAQAGSERARIPSTGGFVIGPAALATTATDGFLYVPTCAGTPTGTPATQTGTAPIIVDTTNNKLYFYSGGQWRDAGP